MASLIDAPRGADLLLSYVFPAGTDLTGYTAAFTVYAGKNGTSLLAVTNTPNGNGSSLSATGNILGLTIKTADIDALPVNSDDATTPALLWFDLIVTTPTPTPDVCKMYGGLMRIMPYGAQISPQGGFIEVVLAEQEIYVEVAQSGFDTAVLTTAQGYATSAQASAATATTQAGVAASQATIAGAQAGIATTEAGVATTGANTATAEAGVATVQAGIAAAQAATATTEAGVATAQAVIATTQAAAAAASAGSLDSSQPRYLFAKLAVEIHRDGVGNIIEAETIDGVKYSPGFVEGVTSSGPRYVAAQQASALFKDGAGNYIGAFNIHGKPIDPTVPATSSAALKALTTYGSSLFTNYAHPTAVPDVLGGLTGRAVNNFALGGNTILHEACIAGAVPIPLTLSGNKIVAGANTVTAIDGVTATGQTYTQINAAVPGGGKFLWSTPSDTLNHSSTGYLGSVHGTLTRSVVSGNEAYMFTPDSGAVLPDGMLPPGTPFVADNTHTTDVIIIEASGYNDFALGGYTTAMFTQITNAVQALLNKFKGNPYVLVTSCWRANLAAQWYGQAAYAMTLQLDQFLAALPNFINSYRMLIDRGLADAGLSPTPTDTIDIGNDVMPTSLRAGDGLHPNQTGANVWALYLENFLVGAGWP